MMDDDIWAEIDAIYKLPDRQLGDIDSEQISKRYGIVQTSAQRRMHRLVDTGKFCFLVVKDNNCANGKRMVIREIK